MIELVLILRLCALDGTDCHELPRIPFKAANFMPTTCAFASNAYMPEALAAHPNKRVTFRCERAGMYSNL